MGRRGWVPLGVVLLGAALCGAAATWVLLAGAAAGPEAAVPPGDAAALQARVAQLERDLEAARAVPRPLEGLAAPPPPAVDARRVALERELAETKARLAQAIAERDAARATPHGALALDGDGALVGGPGVELGPDAAQGPWRGAERAPPRAVDLDEAARLLHSAADEDRRTAYAMLARAPGKEALPLLEEALSTPDAGPLVPPLMQRAALLKDRAWSAIQATGAPDTPIGGDNQTAWAPKQPEMGEVTIDLEYATAVRVDEVRVRETFNPGAVVKVLAFERGRGWDVLWEGVSTPEPAPRWFVPPVRRTSYATATIRLVLDTNRVPGWNEIDAVELTGDGRRQWAQGAVASSSYAD